MPHFYNPNQARVPAGRHGGGQWTLEGGGPDAIVRPAFLPDSPYSPLITRLVPGLWGKVLALFAELSLGNGPDQRAVIKFKAREFFADKAGKLNLEAVEVLDRDEVDNICKKLDLVQNLTNEAARNTSRQLGASNFGTQVHKYVETEINRRKKNKEEKYRTLEAEESFMKTMEEADPKTKRLMEEALRTSSGKPKIPPGAKGSVRVDVLEDVGDKKICVYDIKTGRRGLSFPRMVELADHVADRYGADHQIIVTEIRPMY